MAEDTNGSITFSNEMKISQAVLKHDNEMLYKLQPYFFYFILALSVSLPVEAPCNPIIHLNPN